MNTLDEFGPASALAYHPASVMCRTSQTAIVGHVTERYDESLPSIGAVNPALTAMANAIRVGDRLLSRMA